MHRRTPEQSRRKPKRFKFLEANQWKQYLDREKISCGLQDVPIVESMPLVSDRLDGLIELVISNFIQGWYLQISSQGIFVISVRNELKHILTRLHSRLAEVNVPEFLVYSVVPLLTAHYTAFVESSRSHDLLYSIESKLDLYKSMKSGFGHPGVSLMLPGPNSRKKEKEHFRHIMGQILPLLLSENEANSPIVTDLVRELLSCTILASLIDALSEGDLLNQIIVNLIGSSLERRKQVRRLRAALEKHTKRTPPMDVQNLPPLLFPITSQTLNQWIDAARDCGSRSSLESLLEVTNTARIELNNNRNCSTADIDSLNQITSVITSCLGLRSTSLESILADQKKNRLFKDFLRGIKKDYLLDAWTEIENIKAPLEDVELTTISLKLEFSNKDKIVRIYDKYFSIVDLEIPGFIRDPVIAFVNSNLADATLYNSSRESLLKLQDIIFQRLNSDFFPEFEESEGFEDLKGRTTKPPLLPDTPTIAFKDVAIKDDSDPLTAESRISPAVVTAVESAFEKIMKNSPNMESKTEFPELAEKSNFFYSALYGKLNNWSEPQKDPQNRLSRLFEENSDSDFDDTLSDSTELKLSVNLSNLQLADLEILLAGPGELKLEEQIATLDKDIEVLAEQSEILKSLIKKAELTNNVSELKIIRRSIASLEREISSKELQKEQYIVQENENSLFGKSSIRIQSCFLNSEEYSSFVLYIIEVQKFSSEDPSEIVAGWVVARRFSQFFKLHEYLKQKCPSVSGLKFPKKTVPYSKFQKMQQIEYRKPLLERYLRELLSIPEVCSNPVFRSFLSSEHFDVDRKERKKGPDGIFNRFYQEVAPKVGSYQSSSGSTGQARNEEMLQNIKEMERELRQFDDIDKSAMGKLPFIKPIFELIMALFDLGSKNWLRGRALLVIIQQVLGSTIEKTLTSVINGVFEQEVKLVLLLDSLTGMLFPNEKFRSPPEPRTRIEQLTTRQEAFSIFTVFMDETCSKIFGSRHTNLASGHILEMIQNDYMNRDLFFKIIDVTILQLFPEIDISSPKKPTESLDSNL